MGIFQRAHDIVQAKTNKALDAAEKPDEMLDLSYEKMLEQITQVRRALVDIAASKKRLELQEEQLQHSIDHLQDQAKQALQANREDLAKEALARKATAQQQIDQMEPQHQQLDEEEQKLTKTLDALQKRVNDFRTQKETLKAQYTAPPRRSPRSTRARPGSPSPSTTRGRRSSGRRTRSPPCRPARAPSTSCSSPASSRTSAAEPTTSKRSSTRSAQDAQVDNELAALKAQLGTGDAAPDALTAAAPLRTATRPSPRRSRAPAALSPRGGWRLGHEARPPRRPARRPGPPGGSGRRPRSSTWSAPVAPGRARAAPRPSRPSPGRRRRTR